MAGLSYVNSKDVGVIILCLWNISRSLDA